MEGVLVFTLKKNIKVKIRNDINDENNTESIKPFC